MHRTAPLRILVTLAGLLLLLPTLPAQGVTPPAVLNRGYDLSGQGATLSETRLHTGNVNSNSFGKLFTRRVEGQIYAQPLYVPQLTIPGKGTRNVVFVATQRNNVYALDADSPTASTPLWQSNLGPHATSAEGEFGERYNGGYKDIQPYVGITGTPVIDRSTNTLYVVPFIKRASMQYEHRLVALDLLTGAQKQSVKIEGAIAGSGNDGDNPGNGTVTFNSRKHLQRSALVLHDGLVLISFAGYADTDPYHGWIFGYNAQTLARTVLFCTTPDEDTNSQPSDSNDGEGGIWMGGSPLSVDASGDLYVVTANGNFDAQNGGRNYGSSLLRLRRAGGTLAVQSWFTPYNYLVLNQNDTDVGTTGMLLLPEVTPGKRLALTGSKEGRIFVVDRATMGGWQADSDSQIVQNFKVNPSTNKPIQGTIVYWNGAGVGPRIFVWPVADSLKAFSFNGTSFNTTPAATGSQATVDWPGGVLSLSANGSAASSGIVWASHGLTGSANTTTRPGMLRAFRATDLVEIWNSQQNIARDTVGNFAKFNPPMVANGKVYMSSFADNAGTVPDELVVYGLLNAPTIAAAAGNDQSAQVLKPFATPLKVRVTRAGSPGSALSGVSVTLSAPTTGPSGTFANGGTTYSATSDSSGFVTVPSFTANGKLGSYTIIATVDGDSGAGLASFTLRNTVGDPASIAASAGTPQRTTVETAFSSVLQARVMDAGGNPVGGVSVTFSAPTSGPSGSFPDGSSTYTATSNNSGIATAPVFTANATRGSYTMTASVGGADSASFSLTNDPLIRTSFLPQLEK